MHPEDSFPCGGIIIDRPGFVLGEPHLAFSPVALVAVVSFVVGSENTSYLCHSFSALAFVSCATSKGLNLRAKVRATSAKNGSKSDAYFEKIAEMCNAG